MSLTPTPRTEHARQIDGVEARAAADRAATQAVTLGLSGDLDVLTIEKIAALWRTAQAAEDYAAAVDADDFLGGAK